MQVELLISQHRAQMGYGGEEESEESDWSFDSN